MPLPRPRRGRGRRRGQRRAVRAHERVPLHRPHARAPQQRGPGGLRRSAVGEGQPGRPQGRRRRPFAQPRPGRARQRPRGVDRHQRRILHWGRDSRQRGRKERARGRPRAGEADDAGRGAGLAAHHQRLARLAGDPRPHHEIAVEEVVRQGRAQLAGGHLGGEAAAVHLHDELHARGGLGRPARPAQPQRVAVQRRAVEPRPHRQRQRLAPPAHRHRDLVQARQGALRQGETQAAGARRGRQLHPGERQARPRRDRAVGDERLARQGRRGQHPGEHELLPAAGHQEEQQQGGQAREATTEGDDGAHGPRLRAP